MQASLNQKNAEYNSQTEYYIKILNTLKTIKDKKGSLDKIDSALPSAFSFAPIIYFLQKKGIDNGLTIKSINFSKDLSKTYEQVLSTDYNRQYKNVGLTLGVSGSYQNLKNFIHSIETSARIFEVNSISLRFAQGSTQSSQVLTESKNQSVIYEIQLELQTYTY